MKSRCPGNILSMTWKMSCSRHTAPTIRPIGWIMRRCFSSSNSSATSVGKRCSTWWTKLWVTDLLYQPVHVVHLIRAQAGQRWPDAAFGKSHEIHHGFHAGDLISAAACAQRVESDHIVAHESVELCGISSRRNFMQLDRQFRRRVCMKSHFSEIYRSTSHCGACHSGSG